MGLDRQAFRELFERQREPVFRFLYRLTGNRADAEDLLQDAFVAVWRKRAQYEGRGSPAGFLRQTAYRLFVNQWKKARRRQELAPGAGVGTGAIESGNGSAIELQSGASRTVPATAGQVADREAHRFLMERVHAALAALPESSREAFVMFRFDGLSAREIAEATDTPVKTVETRVRRATLALAERLGRYRHLQAG